MAFATEPVLGSLANIMGCLEDRLRQGIPSSLREYTFTEFEHTYGLLQVSYCVLQDHVDNKEQEVSFFQVESILKNHSHDTVLEFLSQSFSHCQDVLERCNFLLFFFSFFIFFLCFTCFLFPSFHPLAQGFFSRETRRVFPEISASLHCIPLVLV